ncbi:MAG: Kynurenine 3-monooxygenase [Chroococcidiopsis cubana SAG 39.79]|uniref:Kynurenine 3-monooxygenase n=1 Tax=Chroococcidiopsis cubana SAG 39.79 TaxID=388085 RepID=A0AB37UAY6_9CYAN|nr:NAD(P)/FAD-dependent oxidoreductase [Chroococcidiopsis cubana]MDZ4877265.1 Kynurenine 3-monooxygenase [Chroococcidiopsis cubana SAG 39.79]PSB63305.1 FAD-dependent monooxygenase [Chroococcidiopsis cubana CCALA 043]RUT02979.1 kynurenine 3-monooxygenase [Chroococcidiopsis cubana SAG 39.79]
MLQKVVIIGAGPAGLLLAHYLLRRRKYCVELYERRSDPRVVDASQDRTFPISLQERGRKAIRALAGLEEAIAQAGVFCNGSVMHRKQGKARKISRATPLLTIDRNRLVMILLQHLTQTYSSEQLLVKFGYQCVQVDRRAKTVTLQMGQGEAFAVAYDALVAADGARSHVRDYLAQDAGLQCEQNYVPDAYKSVFLSRLNPALGLELEHDKIHGWNRDNKTRMLMVPQPGERLNGVIIFDAQENPLSSLSTKEEVLTFFQENFPLFGQLMSQEEAEAFLHRPVGRVLTVSCARFHDGDSILLIGDAAHAVSPSIGQGCNASLEDVLIFGQLLEQYEDDWELVLPAFSEQRVPDAHALGELSNYSFPRTKTLVLEFFLRLTMSRLLHRWFPKWVKPFVFDLVLDRDLSYSQVLNLSQGWINKVKRSSPHAS